MAMVPTYLSGLWTHLLVDIKADMSTILFGKPMFHHRVSLSCLLSAVETNIDYCNSVECLCCRIKDLACISLHFSDI